MKVEWVFFDLGSTLTDEGEFMEYLFRESIKMMWKKAKAPLCDARQRFNTPSYGRYFEYLYNELQKREQTQ